MYNFASTRGSLVTSQAATNADRSVDETVHKCWLLANSTHLLHNDRCGGADAMHWTAGGRAHICHIQLDDHTPSCTAVVPESICSETV